MGWQSSKMAVLLGYTGDAAELNKLDGLTASQAELNKVDVSAQGGQSYWLSKTVTVAAGGLDGATNPLGITFPTKFTLHNILVDLTAVDAGDTAKTVRVGINAGTGIEFINDVTLAAVAVYDGPLGAEIPYNTIAGLTATIKSSAACAGVTSVSVKCLITEYP